MKLGQAYVEGYLRVEGPIQEIIRVAESLARGAAARGRSGFGRFARHTRKRDRKAIQYHYDVSNEFYALWLDRNMVYSCAYFHQETDSLDTAQEQKLDHILPPSGSGYMQRGDAVFLLRVYIGFPLKQRFHDGCLSCVHRPMQSRRTVLVFSVHQRRIGLQQLHH